MKKHFLILLMLISLFKFGYSQVPSAIPYQAVVRNGTGNILPNHPVQLRFSIQDSITNGIVLYQETHSISTNGQGLVITNIGQGTSTIGTFSGINWGKNNKFVQTELSINNDNTFTDLGTTQFLSVPYALHSGNGMPKGSAPGEMLFWDGTNWVKVAPGQGYGQPLVWCDGVPTWGGCLAKLKARLISVGVETAYVTGEILSSGGLSGYMYTLNTLSIHGFCWSTRPNPTIDSSQKTEIGWDFHGGWEDNLIGLLPNTTYYVRYYAINSAGTAYSNEISFTTLQISPPTINTIMIDDTSSAYSISCGGEITFDGNSNITSRGLCWSTSPNPTIDLTTKTTDGTGTGSFTSSITGLTPNTTYYIRSYATNSSGTSYGNEVSFTTKTFTENLNNGLVAYYPFNGNANDESGNGNNGIVNGATLTTDRFGNENSAYNFDGVNDFIQLPFGISNQPITISAWFRTNSIGFQSIVDADIGGQYGNNLILSYAFQNCDNIVMLYHDGVFKSPFSYNTYQDYNVIGIWQNGICSLYMNGSYIGSQTFNQGVNEGGNYRIGVHSNFQGWFNGKIDDIRIYNRALTQEEIIYLATQDSSGNSDDNTNKGVGVTDIDGNTYDTIRICNQTWTKKNLNVSRYRNGDIIPQVTNPTQWANLTTGAWCYYNNDSSNGNIYGKLYNWYAVNDPRGLAPEGWHVASDGEWTILTDCLGGASAAGGKIKEDGLTHWISPNLGATNSSGFTALPGGILHAMNSSFIEIGNTATWWTSTEFNSALGSLRGVFFNVDTVYKGFGGWKYYGLSVRIVKDEPQPTINEGISDIDGHTYPTVQICNQTWMAKNLNVARYRNGDIIPQVTDPTQWINLTTGAWCWYNNDSATYGSVYGRLYNWYAVNDPRGLAPEGWHVPCDGEWNQLVKCIDSNADTSVVLGDQSSVAGGYMKEVGLSHWNAPNMGATNSSGFNGLPSGNRDPSQGNFGTIGSNAIFWSSTESTSNSAWVRYIFDYQAAISKSNRISKNDGFSVRCVKDTPITTLNDGLVAYYPFNGNANDESGNGNNGTVNGASLTTDRFGNSGKAYSFDGVSSVINIPSTQPLNISNNISICAWIYRADASSVDGEGIFGPSNFLPTTPGYYFRIIDRKVDLGISYPYTEGLSNQTIDGGHWFYLVGTYDNNSIKIYINGVLDNITIIGPDNLDASTTSTGYLTIGKEAYDGAPTFYHQFNGYLDDIRIYNRALTQEEISYLATH
jgi:uncharacterized protein (TIGR02145 family)